MTDPSTATLVKDAIHNPNEPRHFMRIVPSHGRQIVTAAGNVIADSEHAVVVKEVGLDIYDPAGAAVVDVGSTSPVNLTTAATLHISGHYMSA